MKKCIFVVLLIMLSCSYAFAQNSPVDTGAAIISGMASFTSSKVKDAENSTTNIAVVPVVNYFIAPNIFLGGAVEYNSMKHGDYTSSSLGIGPSVGYAIGNKNSSTFPFIGARYMFNSSKDSDGTNDDKATGTRIFIGGGLIAAVKDHIGIVIEAGYNIMSDKPDGADESTSSSMISVGIGISGLLY